MKKLLGSLLAVGLIGSVALADAPAQPVQDKKVITLPEGSKVLVISVVYTDQQGVKQIRTQSFPVGQLQQIADNADKQAAEAHANLALVK